MIDKRFHTPLHVAAVVIKVLKILHWRVIARVALELPGFLAVLVATQTRRKARKWMGRAKRAVPSPAEEGAAHGK